MLWKMLVPELSFSWKGVKGLPAVPLLTLGSVAAPKPVVVDAPKGDVVVLGVPKPPPNAGLLVDPKRPPPVDEEPKPEVLAVLLAPKAEVPDPNPVLVLVLAPKGDELVFELPNIDPRLLLLPKTDPVLLLVEPNPPEVPNPPPVLEPPKTLDVLLALAPNGEVVVVAAVFAFPNGEVLVVLLFPNPPKPELVEPNIADENKFVCDL